jgi:hypothetical protein
MAYPVRQDFKPVPWGGLEGWMTTTTTTGNRRAGTGSQWRKLRPGNRNGLLEIHVPKGEDARSKRDEVKARGHDALGSFRVRTAK